MYPYPICIIRVISFVRETKIRVSLSGLVASMKRTRKCWGTLRSNSNEKRQISIKGTSGENHVAKPGN